jgi:uncharacterized caspase-like protein
MRIAFCMISMALALALAALPARAEEPARIALLIGNSKYASAVGPLKNPGNDIALIQGTLLKIGFAKENIAVAANADRVGMLQAFEKFARRVGGAGREAIGFFYYSGHGAADEKGKNFLIPVDVTDASEETFWLRAVNLQELIGQLNEQAPEAKHFVVFDACRNTLKLSKSGTKSLTQAKGFVPVVRIPGGMLIAYATADGETASDQGDGAGPYARALAGEIVKPGVEAFTAFRNVQLRLRETIKQEPWMQHNGMGAVYFAGREAPAAPQVQPAAAQAQPSEAARAWAEVKDMKDIAVLEVFRRQFGAKNPLYDALASKRIDEVKRSQPAVQEAAPHPLPAGRKEEASPLPGAAAPAQPGAQWPEGQKPVLSVADQMQADADRQSQNRRKIQQDMLQNEMNMLAGMCQPSDTACLSRIQELHKDLTK